MSKKIARYFHCPIEFTLTVLGGKWKTMILCCLNRRPCRYAELRKLLPGLSDKILTQRLRELAESGLVVQQRVAASPRTRFYALSPMARSLSKFLTHLSAWGLDHAEAFGVQIGHPGDPFEELDRERQVG